MSRVRVLSDIQNPKPGIFIVTIDNYRIASMGDRQQVIEDLKDLWEHGYMDDNQYREFIDKLRGK